MASAFRNRECQTLLSWQGIRSEYFKVWNDFQTIAAPFGITLTDDQLDALGHMLVSMDVIDSAVDREPIQRHRLVLCDAILAWMHGGDLAADKVPDEVDTDRLLGLRDFIFLRRIRQPFLDAASRVFLASENKRNATTISALVRNLIAEGQAAAEMTIAVLGKNTNLQFNQFLQRIMRIGTIVDTLLDADDDFAIGILKMKPTRIFRWRLKLAIGSKLPQLVFGFPDRMLLWRYCLSYTGNRS